MTVLDMSCSMPGSNGLHGQRVFDRRWKKEQDGGGSSNLADRVEEGENIA
jgi:hypothetical protein